MVIFIFLIVFILNYCLKEYVFVEMIFFIYIVVVVVVLCNTYSFTESIIVYIINKAIGVMCIAHLRAFIQQTNTHTHKQPRLD